MQERKGSLVYCMDQLWIEFCRENNVKPEYLSSENDGLSSLLNGKQDGCACVLGMEEETELSSHLQWESLTQKHQDVLPQTQHSEIGGKMKGKVAQREESSSFLGEGERGVLIVFLSNSWEQCDALNIFLLIKEKLKIKMNECVNNAFYLMRNLC